MQTLLDNGLLHAGLPLAPSGAAAATDNEPDFMALLMDQLAHGVLVINARGRIFHANEAARRELARGNVLTDSHGELRVALPADAAVLQGALGKAVDGKRSLLKLPGSGADVMLAVIPINWQAGAPCERIALFLSRRGVCDSGVFGSFARCHGLTHTEEQVLASLCRCLSTPEIALQMKVAVSTIRSHVRSLCIKTGSSGVRELVNRVAILPPIAPLPLGQIH